MSSNNVIEINNSNYEEEVLKSEKLVIMKFWAPWCGPCKSLAPVIEKIADEQQHIKVCSVHVDEQSEIATQHGVRGIPAVIVIKDGETVDTVVGYHPKNHYVEIINKHQ